MVVARVADLRGPLGACCSHTTKPTRPVPHNRQHVPFPRHVLIAHSLQCEVGLSGGAERSAERI
eukprot:51907-Eustigmatos_ZCMA.PRE.1